MSSDLIDADDTHEAVSLPSLPEELTFSETLNPHDPLLPSDNGGAGSTRETSHVASTSVGNAGQSIAPMSLAVTSQIAAAIARPLGALKGDCALFGALHLDDVRAIAHHPFFTGPMNRATAQLSGLSAINFDIKHLRRLGYNQASQLALMLATSKSDHISQACLLIGAIVLHKHLLARALKYDIFDI